MQEKLKKLYRIRAAVDGLIAEIEAELKPEQKSNIESVATEWRKCFDTELPRYLTGKILNAKKNGITDDLLVYIVQDTQIRNVKIPGKYFEKILERCCCCHILTVEDFDIKKKKKQESYAGYNIEWFERMLNEDGKCN